jgi:phage gpG-like protein
MKVTGDFEELRRLRARIAQLQSAGFRRDVATVLGGAAKKLVQDQFNTSRDPYGAPWKPLAHKRRRGELASAKVLQNTGVMLTSLNYRVDPSGVRLSMPVSYAAVHQYGATIPARSNATGQVLHGRYLRNGQFRFSKKSKASVAMRGRPATFGQVTIPQRQIFPDAARGLPQPWLEAFNLDALGLIRRRLGGG